METCPFCGEPIYPDQPTHDIVELVGMGEIKNRIIHLECHIRTVLGSVGHQTGECECHGKEDVSEYGMSARNAALAAYAEFVRRSRAEGIRIQSITTH